MTFSLRIINQRLSLFLSSIFALLPSWSRLDECLSLTAQHTRRRVIVESVRTDNHCLHYKYFKRFFFLDFSVLGVCVVPISLFLPKPQHLSTKWKNSTSTQTTAQNKGKIMIIVNSLPRDSSIINSTEYLVYTSPVTTFQLH